LKEIVFKLTLLILFVFSIVFLVGCSNSDNASAPASSASGAGGDEEGGTSPSASGPSAGGASTMGPSTMPSSTGMPGAGMTGSTGMPGATGMAGAGMSGMAGSPMGGMSATGTTGMAGATQALTTQPAQPKLTFSKAPKVSDAKLVTRKDGFSYYIFKFADEKGIIYKCKLPKVEAENKWSAREWLATFKAFRFPTAAENNKIAAAITKEKLGSFSWPISLGADSSTIAGYPKKEAPKEMGLMGNNAGNFNRPGAGLNPMGGIGQGGLNMQGGMNPLGIPGMGNTGMGGFGNGIGGYGDTGMGGMNNMPGAMGGGYNDQYNQGGNMPGAMGPGMANPGMGGYGNDNYGY